MATPSEPPQRLMRAADLGRLVARGRRRAKISQGMFAEQIGVSRRTLSDLERGAAEHISLQTAIKALALAGFVLQAQTRRLPTLAEVMTQRAAYRRRVDELTRT